MNALPIFVWRGTYGESTVNRGCPYCKRRVSGPTPLHDPDESLRRKSGELSWSHFYILRCPVCGWWAKGVTDPEWSALERLEEATLLEFDLNDSRVLLSELRSHLARHHRDIGQLSPRRFEEVVGDVYRALGWQVEVTLQTRDGGVDLVCVRHPSGQVCVVECKRYAHHRKVGIDVVDRLLGASFRIGASSAHLVTTSSFTRPSRTAQAEAVRRGLELELVDGHKLLELLRTFSDPTLTVEDLAAVFAEGD